eukprot:2269919-Rhodomonas_salina.2
MTGGAVEGSCGSAAQRGSAQRASEQELYLAVLVEGREEGAEALELGGEHRVPLIALWHRKQAQRTATPPPAQRRVQRGSVLSGHHL